MGALESLVDFVPRVGQDSMHSTLEECTAGLARMYSGHIGPVHGPQWEIQPLNQQSLGWGVEPYQPPVFESEPLYTGYGSTFEEPSSNLNFNGVDPRLDMGYGDMSPINSDILGQTYELDQGWKLGERMDFSEHGGSEPHLNYDLIRPNNKLFDKASDILGKEQHYKKVWD